LWGNARPNIGAERRNLYASDLVVREKEPLHEGCGITSERLLVLR
jgi:hypothetical protein